MIPDLDIYRAANVITKQYGEDAPIVVTMLEKANLDDYHIQRNSN